MRLSSHFPYVSPSFADNPANLKSDAWCREKALEVRGAATQTVAHEKATEYGLRYSELMRYACFQGACWLIALETDRNCWWLVHIDDDH